MKIWYNHLDSVTNVLYLLAGFSGTWRNGRCHTCSCKMKQFFAISNWFFFLYDMMGGLTLTLLLNVNSHIRDRPLMIMGGGGGWGRDFPFNFFFEDIHGQHFFPNVWPVKIAPPQAMGGLLFFSWTSSGQNFFCRDITGKIYFDPAPPSTTINGPSLMLSSGSAGIDCVNQ